MSKSNDTYLNILASYAYLNGKGLAERLAKISSAGEANIMIDSGAFTAHNASGNFSHVNVEQYTDFCLQYEPYFEKFVMLDVLGNEAASKKNYEYMVARGATPMFVLTVFDNDFDYLRSTMKVTPHICVATAGRKNDWAIKRYQDAYKQTNGQCLTHALGFITYPRMLQIPIVSADSSSWKASALRFGNLQYFDNGLKSLSVKNLYRGKEPIPKKLREVLEFCGVTPAMFRNTENHKGNFSIACYISTFTNLMLARYCYKRGLRYFLAINNEPDIDKILYIYENLSHLSYQQFRNL